MSDKTAVRPEVQSFLLRLTRYDANEHWHLLLKPIDGDEHFLFADVATFVDTLSSMVEETKPTPQQGAQPDRRDQ